MSILQARGLALRFAQEHPLFHNVDFDINPGDRIALTGPNGAGKSSLLRLLAGELPFDAGTIVRRRGLVTASFAQSNPGAPDAAIWEWPEDVEPLLRGLGFDTADLYTPLAHLSAGQRSRAFLARALAQAADLLLLDEPTNHLDSRARQWLEHHLLRRQTTCLFVSHDEEFLARVATRVFELRRGQFHVTNAAYETHLHHTELQSRQSWQAYESEQRQLAQLERAARRRDVLAAKVARIPPGGSANARAFYNAKSARVARTARLLRERLAPESRIDKPWEEQAIPQLDFASTPRPSDPPIAIENLTLAYTPAAPVVQNLNVTLRRHDRCHLHGPNGSGKTTLLRAILGDLSPAAGAIRLGPNVRLGYFAQEAETLRGDETPLDACLRFCPDRTWVQTILACLKLPRDYVQVPIARLSLGERAKTALAQVLVSGANLLLLDEPTNHLEIEARHALLDTLDQFPGAILFTSHDPGFAADLATQSLPLSRA